MTHRCGHATERGKRWFQVCCVLLFLLFFGWGGCAQGLVALACQLLAPKVYQVAVWSSGMILASGVRGPGLNSQNNPCACCCRKALAWGARGPGRNFQSSLCASYCRRATCGSPLPQINVGSGVCRIAFVLWGAQPASRNNIDFRGRADQKKIACPPSNHERKRKWHNN